MCSGCILTPWQEASRAAQAHFSYKKRGQIADSCTKNRDLWWGEMGVSDTEHPHLPRSHESGKLQKKGSLKVLILTVNAAILHLEVAV